MLRDTWHNQVELFRWLSKSMMKAETLDRTAIKELIAHYQHSMGCKDV